jgi:arylmalonate decarboxylase
MNQPQGVARIGLIIPPADGLRPRECATLYPQIEFVTIGLGIREMSSTGFEESHGRTLDCAQALARAGVEAISVMGTSLTFYRGRSYNERLCALVSSETGLPVTSMSTSIIRALKANHVARVALATAYTQDLNDRLSDFLAEYDIQTAGVAGLGLTDINAVRPTSPEAVCQAAEAAFQRDTSANGILISCGGLPTLQLHVILENQFNIPVISSLPAGLWDVVQLSGSDPRAAGFGRMFASAINDDAVSLASQSGPRGVD